MLFSLIITGCPSTGHPAAWDARAKGTLRSTGSSLLAYQGQNDNNHYGSFQALQDTLFIADGYTLGNMIENYSMTWSVSNVSTVVSEEFPYGVVSTFKIIAYPRETNQRCLMTFAVTEDQVVRAFNPDNENEFLNLKFWDPIL